MLYHQIIVKSNFHSSDCIITSIVNAMTSVFAGITVFAYLGYLARLMRTPVESVTGEGNNG